MNRNTIAVIAAAFLTACASVGPKFTQLEAAPPASSKVYFYRQSNLVRGGHHFRVEVDGQRVGLLKNGSYIVADVPAGEHTVQVVLDSGVMPIGGTGEVEGKIKITTEANKLHFVKFSVVATQFNTVYSVSSKTNLGEVSEQNAISELKELGLGDK